MKPIRRSLAIAAVALAGPANAADFSALLTRIELPPGFTISVFGEMPAPRQIAVLESGDGAIIGSKQGHIYLMRDEDGDGSADLIDQLAGGLSLPNGVVVRESTLFVGMRDRIASVPLAGDRGAISGSLTTILDDVRSDSHHGRRYLGFGPDGRLYAALGAPCNICRLEDNTGKIVAMNPDGTGLKIVADGIRNSVGFDWHPVTGELWFTDNGADRMGDDIPPDELNRVSGNGQHFGFPYFGGSANRLTGFENDEPPDQVIAPEVEFQAHTASLGMEFYDGDMFPDEFKGDAFVAQHGSWNRSEPVGYRIMRVRFDERAKKYSQRDGCKGAAPSVVPWTSRRCRMVPFSFPTILPA
jgi:glucose/arabinose dehydrogenase